MNAKRLNQDRVYAKIIALSVIYSKEESCQRIFLQRISYSSDEMTAVKKCVRDTHFRNWIESSIPMMHCIIS